MDCLDPASGLDLQQWEIRTAPDVPHIGDRVPAIVGSRASVSNALVARGCQIDGEVVHSILFPGVRVEEGAVVRDAIIMQDSVIGKGSRIEYAIVDKRCAIGADCVVGRGPGVAPNRKFPGHLDCGITLLGKGTAIPARTRIGGNCILYPGVNLTGRALDDLADGETIME